MAFESLFVAVAVHCSNETRNINRVATGHVIDARGNRFSDMRALASMTKDRLARDPFLFFFVNLILAYGSTLDPTNRPKAMRCAVLEQMNFRRIAPGMFCQPKLRFEQNAAAALPVIRGVSWLPTAPVLEMIDLPGGTT